MSTSKVNARYKRVFDDSKQNPIAQLHRNIGSFIPDISIIGCFQVQLLLALLLFASVVYAVTAPEKINWLLGVPSLLIPS